MGVKFVASENKANGWQRKVVQPSDKQIERVRQELREAPLSTIVIKTGARRYGLPADAKERRM